MKASAKNIAVGNTIVFNCEEYQGQPDVFDGSVQLVDEKGVCVVYLSGYKSRNDFIPWKDIIAKLDKRYRWITLKGNAPYSGHFLEFDNE